MARDGEDFVFGSFLPDEVAELFRTEVEDLEFVWLKKRGFQAPQSLLDIPQTVIPRSYSPGGPSPNIPHNPPTTPVSEVSSRASTPNPTQSRLNANAPPFIPSSLSGLGDKGSSPEPAEVGGKERGRESVSPVRKESGGSSQQPVLQDEGAAVPVQTVGMPTPSLPSTSSPQSTETEASGRQTEPAAPPSICSSVSDAARSPNSTPLSSPLSTAHNHLSQSLGSPPPSQPPPKQPLPDTDPQTSSEGGAESTLDHTPTATPTPRTNCLPAPLATQSSAVSGPPLTHHTVTPTTPPPQPHTVPPNAQGPSPTTQTSPGTRHPVTPTPSHNGTHHTTTVPSKPKTWAAVVSNSGCGQSSQVSPPTTGVRTGDSGGVKCEGGEEGKGRVGKGQSGEGLDTGEGGRTEDAQVSSLKLKRSPHLRSLGEQLKVVSIHHSPVSIQPRGLINQGNWCYMHAPLQALISVPEIFHLLRSLNPNPPLSTEPSDTPLTDTMTQFVGEFEDYQPPPQPVPSPTKPGNKKKRPAKDCVYGSPFRPDCVYNLLYKIRTSLSTKGRQEDAEEFLGCVLDGLHEEMVSALKTVQEEVEEGEGEGQGRGQGESEEGKEQVKEEEGEWEQVGPKNRSTITRQTSFNGSPISEVFGGELRAVLQRHGAKESATVEPFFSLQLDIQSEKVWSVKDAIEALATKETVQMISGTNSEVEAHRRLSLAHLPVVLILHLKRFLFDKTGGSQKLLKHMQYSMQLEVGKELLAPAIKNKLTLAQRTYKLWAVVYHHGKSAVGGHYTCDVHHPALGGWLRIDDSIIKPVPEEAVLKQSPMNNKVAYLLFYRRTDSIRSK